MYQQSIGPVNFFLGLLCFLLWGCVDPVDLKPTQTVKYLAVQGLITDEPGPYTVNVRMTVPYGRPTGIKEEGLRGAQVVITDERGAHEVLREHGLGIFKTSPTGMRGRVGGVYTLSVTLKDGRNYQSTAEVLAPVAPIEELELDFQRKPVFDQGPEPIANQRFEAFVRTKDPGNAKNFYRWEWKAIYEVSTQPWDYEEVPPRGSFPIPKPKKCCQTCWVYDTTNLMVVGEDRLFNGNTFRKPVGIVPLTGETINVRLRVEAVQYSLSETGYDFWEDFIAQSRSVGSVLDPPPANAKGNVRNLANPEEPVFGYFGASAVTRKAVFVKREEVPQVPGLLKYPDDCRTIKFSSEIRPSFW
ncbi:hypothetical protein TH63_13315 [Rufibacter radiotolerans]|uniref:DUF4249 domain-containing protein n=1 Tax=Rufibacter radiotolerans TaxID=1379910 RepID=A0A0H4VRI3_9BACT|nr:DUF4249 domain-containing protein [Rufibacter radiotolerans]AKQ46379.1 hypothetical protein TH63_13315 [Rufibacter radiotolerans]